MLAVCGIVDQYGIGGPLQEVPVPAVVVGDVVDERDIVSESTGGIGTVHAESEQLAVGCYVVLEIDVIPFYDKSSRDVVPSESGERCVIADEGGIVRVMMDRKLYADIVGGVVD